jgi:hypothetical protein
MHEIEANAEEWLPIPGFPDYEASTSGTIRSRKWGYWKTLRPGRHPKTGYWLVCVRVNGKYVTRNVHRLVARTFLGEANGRDVNHKNGNKDDNSLANLEYLTRGENHRHAYRTKLRAPVGKKLTDEQVIQISEMKGAASQTTIAKRFGVCRQTVGLIHSRRRHQSILA